MKSGGETAVGRPFLESYVAARRLMCLEPKAETSTLRTSVCSKELYRIAESVRNNKNTDVKRFPQALKFVSQAAVAICSQYMAKMATAEAEKSFVACTTAIIKERNHWLKREFARRGLNKLSPYIVLKLDTTLKLDGNDMSPRRSKNNNFMFKGALTLILKKWRCSSTLVFDKSGLPVCVTPIFDVVPYGVD